MSASGGFSFVKVSIERVAARAARGDRVFVADFTAGAEFVQRVRDAGLADSFSRPQVAVIDGLPADVLAEMAYVAARGGAEMVVLYKVPGETQVRHLHRVSAPRVLCEVA